MLQEDVEQFQQSSTEKQGELKIEVHAERLPLFQWKKVQLTLVCWKLEGELFQARPLHEGEKASQLQDHHLRLVEQDAHLKTEDGG